jgi:acyl carrier protein
LKDLVIVRGENHYPQDIEATVCHAHPALEPNGAAAFALEGATGETLVVVIELRREGFRRLDPPAIFAGVRRAVAEEHGLDPSCIVLLRPGTLPRTSSGKVQRRGCRQDWQAGELPVVAQWSAAADTAADAPAAAHQPAALLSAPGIEREFEVLQLCRALLAPERVELATNLFEAGADSLKMADIALAIEERWGVSLDLADLAEHATPASLARLVASWAAARKSAAVPVEPAPAGESSAGRSRLAGMVSRLLAGKRSKVPAASAEGTANTPVVGQSSVSMDAATFFLGDSAAHPSLSLDAVGARLLPYVSAWRGTRAQARSLVTGLHLGGSHVPLFWVFQGHQEWSALGTALGPQQPLYGMRSGHLVMPYTEANIQALATAYRREIQALWPDGPYLIGGNCQGGLIALAIAQQLWRLQQPVAMLALMEWGFGPQAYAGRVALLWGEDSDKNPFRKSMDPAVLAKRLYRAHTIDLLPGAHGQFFDPQRVGHLARALRNRIDEALVDAPPFLPPQARRAALQILDAPEVIDPGSTVRLEVEVRNVSAWHWERAEVSGLWLGGKWMDDAGSVLEVCARLAPLPAMTPGAVGRFRVDLTAPIRRGAVVFEARLLEDGVGWFEDCATQAARIRIGER